MFVTHQRLRGVCDSPEVEGVFVTHQRLKGVCDSPEVKGVFVTQIQTLAIKQPNKDNNKISASDNVHFASTRAFSTVVILQLCHLLNCYNMFRFHRDCGASDQNIHANIKLIAHSVTTWNRGSFRDLSST